MKPELFKHEWLIDEPDNWVLFEANEVEKSPLNVSTKGFLSVGFPKSAAPFLDFGWKTYGGKFLNISACYPSSHVNGLKQNYWIFGSDGAGNPICFDISSNDKIVLLDHEQGFELITIINKDIVELASCLLLYKKFIDRVQTENGEDAFFDLDISKTQLTDLENDFKQINFNIFIDSPFWRSEINNLTER